MKHLWFILVLVPAFSQDLIVSVTGKKYIVTIDSTKSTEKKIFFKNLVTGWEESLNKSSIKIIRRPNGKFIFPSEFIVNKKSKKIHLSNVNHLPDDSLRIITQNILVSEKNGFRKCEACFQNVDVISDLSTENVIRKQLVLTIQNSEEIMYEHVLLPNLQSIMDKVLKNWPETLKGYSYRIQIIRDAIPNAYAVPGGNIYITTGMLDMAENDNEIESIIAHEVAHIEQRHSLRSYEEYLKKKKLWSVGLLGLLIFADIQNSEQASILAGAIAGATAVALEIYQKGYDRDLEQEADLYAQLYFSKNNQSKKPFIRSLDKLLTYTIMKMEYKKNVNAYTSHPVLRSRILQVSKGKHHVFEESQKFNIGGSKVFDDGKLFINLNYIYRTVSSTSSTYEIIIGGMIENLDDKNAFQIDKINIDFLNGKKKELKGTTKPIILSENSKSFSGRFSCTKEESDKFLELAISKNIKIKDVQISGLRIDEGGQEYIYDYKLRKLLLPAKNVLP